MKMLSNFLQKAASFSGADLNQSFPARQSYARWNPLTWQRAMNEGTTTSRREQVRKNYEKHNFFLTGPRSQFSIPSSTQIKSELKRSSADVDPLYYGMVRELTNQASGGRSNPSSYWRGLDQLEEQRLSQGGYSTPGLTKEEFKNYLKNLQHLLESVNFKNIPGFNGLQKACALLKVLEQQSQKIKGRP